MAFTTFVLASYAELALIWLQLALRHQTPTQLLHAPLSCRPSKQHRQALFLSVTFVTESFPAAKVK